jgi:hypothetical protein
MQLFSGRRGAGMSQDITKSVTTLLAEANAAVQTVTIDEARALHGRDDGPMDRPKD